MTPTAAINPEQSATQGKPKRPSRAKVTPKTVVSARVPEQLFMKLRDYTIRAGYLNMSETVAGILAEHFAPKKTKSIGKGKKK